MTVTKERAMQMFDRNTLTAAITSSPAAQPETVKRYSNTYEDGIWSMDERPNGRWVRYSDHERIVKSLEAHVTDRDALLSPSPAASEGEQASRRDETLWDYCPSCAGELDTGFECLKCKRDWREWATFAPDSVRDEGYGWCVWRFIDGIWQTDCGDQFTLDDGGPKENDMDYCCFCGGVIGEA